MNKFEFGPMNLPLAAVQSKGHAFGWEAQRRPHSIKNWFFDGYMAYGTRDEKLKYNALVEYSFNERKEYRKEFPINSIRL